VYAAAIRKSDGETFKRYFMGFFKAFNIDFKDGSLLDMMMDFSQAQTNGFYKAFAETTGEEEMTAATYLKGCDVRVKKNVKDLIKPFDVVLSFPDPLKELANHDKTAVINIRQKSLRKKVYKLANIKEYEDTIEDIKTNFPKAAGFLDLLDKQEGAIHDLPCCNKYA
jgi:hypothetical protein